MKTSTVCRGEVVSSGEEFRVTEDPSQENEKISNNTILDRDVEGINVRKDGYLFQNTGPGFGSSVKNEISELEDNSEKKAEGESRDESTTSHNPDLGTLSALSAEKMKKLQRAKEFCIEQTAKLQPLIAKTGTLLYPQTLDTAAGLESRTYAVMSRIYVGSINFELNKQHVKAIFSQFGYVKDVSMTIDHDTGRHKGYCFVEFEAPEAAHLALKYMNGTELAGRQLKVGRPNNYNMAIAASAPPQVPSRIYISNINEHITEENISSIFEAFGALKACVLLCDTATLKHKTNGYVEFVDESAVDDTVDNMNGFELGGLNLYVMKAIYGGTLPMGVTKLKSILQSLGINSLKPPDQNPSIDQTTPSLKTVNNSYPGINHEKQAQTSQNEESVSLEENIYISASQRYSIMQKLSRNDQPEAKNGSTTDKTQKPLTGVCLQNIALVKDVDDDFSTEILSECSKFGDIIKLVVSSQNATGGILSPNPEDPVLVHILYKSADSASQAQTTLDKRFFAGRVVCANLCESNTVDTHVTNAIKVEELT